MKRLIHQTLEQNGLKVASSSEMQSFLARAVKTYYSLLVTIPRDIIRYLDIKRDDILEVAIRKATIKEIREYGTFRLRVRMPIRVKCPKCGQLGVLNFTQTSVGVLHYPGKVPQFHTVPSDFAQEHGLYVFRTLRIKIEKAMRERLEKIEEV